MNKVYLIVVLVLLVGGALLTAVPVFACWEGCTPGFWKQEQHFQDWPAELCTEEGWTTLESLEACGGVVTLEDPPQDHLVQDILTIPGCLLTAGVLDLNKDEASDTLLDVLKFQGGEDAACKAKILLRAAVGSLLNGMTEV